MGYKTVETYEDRLRKLEEKLKSAQNPEIQMSFTVRTALDERVCSDCAKHEGIKFDDVYDAVIGVNHPPFHEGCRCIATYKIVGIREKAINQISQQVIEEKSVQETSQRVIATQKSWWQFWK